MNIIFKTKKLEKCAINNSFGVKTLGFLRHKVFKKRLEQLVLSNSLEQVKSLPGKFHELPHDRKGQWSCHLDEPYRLIFKPQENPIPINKDGVYLWSEIKGVEILEIIDYH